MVPFYEWVQLSQGYRTTTRKQITQSPEVPGTHLIDPEE